MLIELRATQILTVVKQEAFRQVRRSKKYERIAAEEARKRYRKVALKRLESGIREAVRKFEGLRDSDVLEVYCKVRKQETVRTVLKA